MDAFFMATMLAVCFFPFITIGNGSKALAVAPHSPITMCARHDEFGRRRSAVVSVDGGRGRRNNGDSGYNEDKK